MLIQWLAKTGLFFSQPYVMLPIIMTGFLIHDEKIYGRTSFLLLFTVVYNLFLKSIWKMPLPAPMKGWAFPSGHTHSALIFWGSLACEYRNRWTTLAAVAIVGLVGFGLVYHNYHYPIDVAGAMVFGSLSLIGYSKLQNLPIFRDKAYRLGLLLTATAAAILAFIPSQAIRPYIWQSLGASIGLTFGWAAQAQHPKAHYSHPQKAYLILQAVAGSIALNHLVNTLQLEASLSMFIKANTIALWVACGKLVADQVFGFDWKEFVQSLKNVRAAFSAEISNRQIQVLMALEPKVVIPAEERTLIFSLRTESKSLLRPTTPSGQALDEGGKRLDFCF